MMKNDGNKGIQKLQNLNKLLNDDPTLRKKVGYEDIRYTQEVDDTSLETAYKVYCKMISHKKNGQNKQ